VQRPVLLGLAAGLTLALLVVLFGRSLLSGHSPPARSPQQQALAESVRIGEVWGASLPDLAGQPQPLRQWQGKVVVLNFWAPWCPPCRREIPGFIHLQGTYGDQGLQFIGVALDEHEAVRAYVEQHGLNYPILLGDLAAAKLSQDAGNQLGGLPYTLILNRQGQPVESVTGELSEARLEGIVQGLL